MAGDWIRMRLDLDEDPAVIQMAERMGLNEVCVVGYCWKVWCWVSRQCNADSVTGVTLEALGRVTRTGNFPRVMADVGWLEEVEVDGKPSIKIPHYDRWLSEGSKQRALTARRVEKHRNAASVTKSLPEKRREEKRREEEKEEERAAGEPAAASPSDPPPGGSTLGEDPGGDSSPPPPPDPPPKPPKFKPQDVPLPFASEAFRKAWLVWCRHRSEIRQPLRPSMCEQQLARLAEWGEARAIAAIRHTVAQGWTGLREPEADRARGAPAAPADDWRKYSKVAGKRS